ncbi:MAG: FecR domain-containing protein [Rikenellaceae bacterium]|nr:FecR domain-containing protein [Rikenellaceae bacterium]MCL2692973.1 FecR domain-containing protein [Rikenellaceae bacterium]
MKYYKNKYEKSRELAEDICRVMFDVNMELEGEELPAIREFLENDSDAPNLLARMADENYLASQLEKFNIGNDDGAVKTLITRIEKAKSHKMRRRRILYYASTAAVLLAVAFIWQLAPKVETISPFTPTELATPTLITDDGRQFDLMAANQISPFIIADQNGLHHIKNNNESSAHIQLNRVVIPVKYNYNLTLEDGTRIMLNANSELSYPAFFDSGDREVGLRGEAWFEVVSDTSRPFIVNLGDLSIRVYGTAFNINTNKSGHVDVLLVEGALGVTLADSEEVMLKPNDLLRYDVENKTANIRSVDPDSYLAWKSGFFMTNLQELGELLDDISSWYGVGFVYRNTNAPKTRISVMIDRNMDLEALLETLQLATGVKITKEKEGLYEIR